MGDLLYKQKPRHVGDIEKPLISLRDLLRRVKSRAVWRAPQGHSAIEQVQKPKPTIRPTESALGVDWAIGKNANFRQDATVNLWP